MLIAMYLIGKANDREFLIIEFISMALYWIFWLSAAAATASTTSWVNSWPSFSGLDCNGVNLKVYQIICSYESADRISVRVCCAFCWLTWGLWTASLILEILEDIIKKKIFTKKGGTASLRAAAATPGAAPVKVSATHSAAGNV